MKWYNEWVAELVSEIVTWSYGVDKPGKLKKWELARREIQLLVTQFWQAYRHTVMFLRWSLTIKESSHRNHRFSITDSRLNVNCCDQGDQCEHESGDESFDTPV